MNDTLNFRLTRFKIEDSFALEPDIFVFAGTVVEGRATPGMRFELPHTGRNRGFTVRSVEFIRKVDGTEMLGLVVTNEKPSYPAGMGSGWICELHD